MTNDNFAEENELPRIKKILLTADDYGVCEFINAAIKKAISEMRINNVGCFVTFPGSETQIKELLLLKDEMEKKIDPTTQKPFKLGIGLHLSISAGSPVSALPADCNMLDGKKLFREPEGYPIHGIVKEQFVQEFRAQVELLGKWIGGVDKIDFVSNHHGIVYMDDNLFGYYLSVLSPPVYDLPVRTPLSWIKSNLRYIGPPIPPVAWEGIKMGYLRHLHDMSSTEINNRRKRMRNTERKSSFCFADTIYGNGRKSVLEHMLKQYNGRTMTTEFMFHLGFPGMEYGTIPQGINGKYFGGRQKEYQSLMSLDLDTILIANEIMRSTFSALDIADCADPE
jgi:predicted glycoside hydrolase/deacetylase ChbG (UPF0249 family)